MRRRRAGAFSLLLLLGAMPCTIAPAAPLPTHAVVEVHPELLQVLARAAEYPFPVVDYTGSDARTVLPAKGRWGAGEYGHLKRLNLFLERPDDIAVRFEAQPVGPGQTRPIARLTIMLRGPAEAEWWSKLPLQGEWGMVRSFREQIGLLVRTTARLVVSKATPAMCALRWPSIG